MNLSIYIYIYIYHELYISHSLDVVPDRAPHDFYRSWCKRKRDGALVKPLSLPPSSTPPQLNNHEYIYRWMYSIYTQEGLSTKEMELL